MKLGAVKEFERKEIGDVFGCSGEAVRRALLKLKITLKKRRSSTKSVAQKSEKSS
jgi:hypothetical protein